VRVLLEAGADTDQASTTDGATPLYISAQDGHFEVVRALVEASANVDKALTTDGCTPLFVAAQVGYEEAVRALVEAGADINLTCRVANGMTPALCAALLGHEEVEKLLRRAPSKVCGNPDCKHTAWTASMKDEFKRCSRCLGVKYCSQSCQRVHWKEHKNKVCNKNYIN
jgi:ankyrin repeat protein